MIESRRRNHEQCAKHEHKARKFALRDRIREDVRAERSCTDGSRRRPEMTEVTR